MPAKQTVSPRNRSAAKLAISAKASSPLELWAKFLEDIRQAREDLGNPSVVWYRGHSHASWSLVPGLFRNPEWPKREKQAFAAFDRTASRLFDKRRTDWEILFDMQHYGIPTRLLDWSEALGVAIAFIMHTPVQVPTDAAVYVLDPVTLNKMSGHKEIRNLPADNAAFDYKNIYWMDLPVRVDRPIAVYPPLQSARLFAQRGVFTIHGHDSRGVEEQAPKAVKKVTLPAGARAAAMEFLQHANLDEYAIYPDIVGMARLLRRQVFEPGA
jgi:hypothetical protein